MMKNVPFWVWLACAFTLAVLPEGPSWGDAGAKKLSIVTTTTDLAAVAGSVAGDHAVIRSICTGLEDPHFIQAKPGYIVAARDADLWIRVGMDLEIGWESPILDGARNAAIREGAPGHLDASESVLKLEVPSGRISRDMGDVHPQGNPHYWLDPLNARIAAKAIADRLCRVEPKHAEDFKKNYASFRDALDHSMFGKEPADTHGGARLWSLLLKGELYSFLETLPREEKLGGWLGQMRPFSGEKVVTYHRSWVYFADRFKLNIIGELEPKPGIPPGPSHLEEIIGLVNREQVKALILEPYYSRKAADFVAAKTGAKVVVCPISVGGAPGIKNYPALIDSIVNQITGAL